MIDGDEQFKWLPSPPLTSSGVLVAETYGDVGDSSEYRVIARCFGRTAIKRASAYLKRRDMGETYRFAFWTVDGTGDARTYYLYWFSFKPKD